ncbi:MAG: acyl-ACP--UDP-N-acetylglucosamine O-acyltransferase, partial [Chthoniobacteraceae bacterium]
TAVIHPQAVLGAGVSIGPLAVIEQGAVLGDGCTVHAHAFVGGHVTLGKKCTVGHGSVLGGDPQDLAFDPQVRSRVVIGDGTKMFESVTIHRGTTEGSETVVGAACFLMGGTHLGHNVRLGSGVITANNALLGGHVQVADRVFIGGGAVFHQHVRVGRLVICQGNSGFSKDIPPFVMTADINGIAGLNVIGLRRAGLDAAQRAEIKRAFDLLYRSGKNTSQALAAASAAEWTEPGREFWDFVAGAKKRGLCDWLGSRRGAVESAG